MFPAPTHETRCGAHGQRLGPGRTAGDVASTLEAAVGGVVGAAADMEDGDGGIGGEALGIAVELLVEHEVANDQGGEGVPVGEVVEEGGQAG